MKASLLCLIAIATLAVGCSSNTNQPRPLDGPRAGELLVFSDLRGTLKPCGCSPDLRRGGVARITDFVKRARQKNPGLPLLHAGNLLVDDEGVPEVRDKQVTRRSTAVVEALGHMGLTAATLGPYDLKQGHAWVARHIQGLKAPLILTNVTGGWEALGQKSLIIPVGSLRLGILGIVPPGVEGILDPKSVTDAAAQALRAKGADSILVLSSLGLRQSKRLMRKLKHVDMMLAGGQDLKAVASDDVEPMGGGHLFQSFIQGGQIGRMAVRLEKDLALSYALTPIGWDLPQDTAVAQIMNRYDTDLKEINLASAGTLPPLEPGQAHYVGVQACLECHEDTKTFWENDKHEKAWETLERDNKTFDLECVNCHTTGYGQPGGSILGALKNLTDVQCEQCHGPGSLHAEDGDPDLIKLKVVQKVCVQCHNEKHSTRFNYKTYKARLMVPGHGKPAP